MEPAPAAKKRDSPAIRWVFRASLPAEAVTEDQKTSEGERLYGELIDHCDLICFQLESAPTTGYLHFQGYFELKNKKRFNWIQSNIQKFEHLAKAKGSPRQNWTYCTKQESQILGPWVLGVPRAEEKENKTALFVADVSAGKTDAELVDLHPSSFARLSNAIDRVREAKRIRISRPKRTDLYGDDFLEVYVFYGAAGTGKSFASRQLYPEIYVLPPTQKGTLWFTPAGNLAPEVLIEDFDGNMPLKTLNQILDPYPVELERKNGFIWFCPKIIIITTNVIPGQWYKYDTRQDVKAQVYRRIKCCFDFNTKEGKEMTKGVSCQELEDQYGGQLTPKRSFPIFTQATDQQYKKQKIDLLKMQMAFYQQQLGHDHFDGNQ